MVWSNNQSCNKYASEIAEIAYKFLDVNGGIAKFYCYAPTDQNKYDMRRGCGPNAEYERPELCNHYESTKRAFDGNIGFCVECDDPACAINRYETQRYA